MTGERMSAAHEAWRALDAAQRDALRILIDIHLVDLVNHWDNDMRETDVEDSRTARVVTVRPL